MYEIKTKDFYKNFSYHKQFFYFSNYSAHSKYYDNSSKLVVGKMKDENASVAIEEFVELKAKIYSYLVNDNSDNKTGKGVNRNAVATISHNKHKNVLLNKKCLRISINRIQGKDNKIGIYVINKISLRCFDDKIYIQNNGCDGLALGYL